MLNFTLNENRCTRCGACAADCASGIISLDSGLPAIAAENEPRCIGCQHCLAVCPTGAVSIFGKSPETSLPLPGALPHPAQLETMIKARRAVRRYRQENLEPELLQKLLEVASYAPSGRNCRKVRFTLVDEGAKLARLRDEMIANWSPWRARGGSSVPWRSSTTSSCCGNNNESIFFSGARRIC